MAYSEREREFMFAKNVSNVRSFMSYTNSLSDCQQSKIRNDRNG